MAASGGGSCVAASLGGRRRMRDGRHRRRTGGGRLPIEHGGSRLAAVRGARYSAGLDGLGTRGVRFLAVIDGKRKLAAGPELAAPGVAQILDKTLRGISAGGAIGAQLRPILARQIALFS